MTKFNNASFLLASAKAVAAATSVDKTIAKAQGAKQAWAEAALAGMKAGKLTLEAIKAQLIDDFRLALPKKEQASFDVENATIADCGSTLKGWYYDVQRVANAGNECIDRVVSGEALTSVRRDTNPKQAQGGKKASPSKALPSLSSSMAAITAALDMALADMSKAKELAKNEQLATIYAKLAKLEKKVSAASVAAPKRKAA